MLEDSIYRIEEYLNKRFLINKRAKESGITDGSSQGIDRNEPDDQAQRTMNKWRSVS